MKPYGNAVLTHEQRYFNYHLNRARMVTEGASGKLKGHWNVLSRKCDSKVETVKAKTLACVVLHNVCIAKGDANLGHWDIHWKKNLKSYHENSLVFKNHNFCETIS